MVKNDIVAQAWVLLIQGATEMENADGGQDRLPAAAKVSRAGQMLINLGGMELAREVHATLGQYQRTVEEQWCGLTDGSETWQRY